jgi:hypothetical protein
MFDIHIATAEGYETIINDAKIIISPEYNCEDLDGVLLKINNTNFILIANEKGEEVIISTRWIMAVRKAGEGNR